jgi:hypothetical protein
MVPSTQNVHYLSLADCQRIPPSLCVCVFVFRSRWNSGDKKLHLRLRFHRRASHAAPSTFALQRPLLGSARLERHTHRRISRRQTWSGETAGRTAARLVLGACARSCGRQPRQSRAERDRPAQDAMLIMLLSCSRSLALVQTAHLKKNRKARGHVCAGHGRVGQSSSLSPASQPASRAAQRSRSRGPARRGAPAGGTSRAPPYAAHLGRGEREHQRPATPSDAARWRAFTDRNTY